MVDFYNRSVTARSIFILFFLGYGFRFDSRYRDDPEVTAMTSLVNAYELEDAIRFEKILQVGILLLVFFPV